MTTEQRLNKGTYNTLPLNKKVRKSKCLISKRFHEKKVGIRYYIKPTSYVSPLSNEPRYEKTGFLHMRNNKMYEG